LGSTPHLPSKNGGPEVLVSICIPTYNGASTIAETLKSCLNQTLQNFEIIISDDNSTDATLIEVQSIDDPRIKILNRETSTTPADNWNRVINAASGHYIKVLGQDDILFTDCLEFEVMVMEKNRHLSPSFCFSRRDIIDETGRTLIYSRGWIPKTGICSFPSAISTITRSGGNPIGEPVVGLIDSDSLKQTQGFTGSYLIDLNMWISLLHIGPALHTTKTLMAFRVGASSWSYKLRRHQASQIISFIKDLKKSFPEDISRFDQIVGITLAYLKPKLRVLVILIARTFRTHLKRR
jgi:glycosyltransferase involved in cell wall biosynthesis